jgi:hypothetical protein
MIIQLGSRGGEGPDLDQVGAFGTSTTSAGTASRIPTMTFRVANSRANPFNASSSGSMLISRFIA